MSETKTIDVNEVLGRLERCDCATCMQTADCIRQLQAEVARLTDDREPQPCPKCAMVDAAEATADHHRERVSDLERQLAAIRAALSEEGA